MRCTATKVNRTCATSFCDGKIGRKDEFKDPIDLFQEYGVGDSPYDLLPNLGYQSFTFSIVCDTRYATTSVYEVSMMALSIAVRIFVFGLIGNEVMIALGIFASGGRVLGAMVFFALYWAMLGFGLSVLLALFLSPRKPSLGLVSLCAFVGGAFHYCGFIESGKLGLGAIGLLFPPILFVSVTALSSIRKPM